MKIKLGNKVMVSDPCYGLDTWCQGVLENVLPGTYNCKVEYSDEGVFGKRVAAIEVVNENCDGIIVFEPEDFEVGVDSGQAGIFDYEYYAKYHSDCKERSHVDDDWYDRVCELTCRSVVNPNYEEFKWEATEDLMEKYEAYKRSGKSWRYTQQLTADQIDELGFVSSSGFGDGSYTCWTARDEDNRIIAIRIEYITEDEYEEEE